MSNDKSTGIGFLQKYLTYGYMGATAPHLESLGQVARLTGTQKRIWLIWGSRIKINSLHSTLTPARR